MGSWLDGRRLLFWHEWLAAVGACEVSGLSVALLHPGPQARQVKLVAAGELLGDLGRPHLDEWSVA